MKALSVQERSLSSFDGTKLAYHVVGKGLPVLLANGLGGSWLAWKHQIGHLLDRYRFISWDYRGLYRSARPADLASLTIEHHARDGLAVLEAEGIERTAIWGWSMGVQVALEMVRHWPRSVAALVLLNGVAGKPWRSVLNTSALEMFVPKVLRSVRAIHPLAEAVTKRVVQWPETMGWAKRLGLASGTLDEALFQELAASFADIDMDVYMRILESLGEHDAEDVLAEIRVPTLVVAGDRDLFTPRRMAERMVRRIAGAELLVVPGGTHYVAVEYPELVSLRIEKFFRERGYAE